MATSSIYTNVRITSNSSCQKLLKALEESKASEKKEVKFSRPVERVPREKIKEYFK